MRWTRRRVLRAAVALAGAAGGAAEAACAAQAGAARTGSERAAGNARTPVKRIALLNLHTGERLELDYFRNGEYLPDSLAAIQVLLRDFRNGDEHPIDPKLMDYLCDVAGAMGVDASFQVISGYRSPQTNEALRERGHGVARRSLHMEGRAIDVRHAGVDCADLAARALGLARGGVGYYRQSNFVHLDTGAFRTWKG